MTFSTSYLWYVESNVHVYPQSVDATAGIRWRPADCHWGQTGCQTEKPHRESAPSSVESSAEGAESSAEGPGSGTQEGEERSRRLWSPTYRLVVRVRAFEGRYALLSNGFPVVRQPGGIRDVQTR